MPETEQATTEQKSYSQYFGELGVERIDEIHASTDKMLVLGDGSNLRQPQLVLDLTLTDKPSTSTEVRDKVISSAVKAVIQVLLGHNVKMLDLPRVFAVLNDSLNESQHKADSRLYGKDMRYELTIADIDQVLNA